ncbi:stress response protein NST1-like [Galendromus occidentalis]|uniref:Stress response protein NST1-like n=1 Tax=Galendromus occidentalis TaxID=34638 RepID=A0AAJ7WGR7_9ACAR|nr:stress response protein NST1-like [Galendromus occidentalis]
MAVDTGEESIETWAGGPSSQNVVTLSKEDFEKLVSSAQRAHLYSLAGNLSISNGNLSQKDDDELPQDLSMSRTQSQPELSPFLKSPIPQRPLSKMEQKQLQWERERAELQAMKDWGTPSMVGTPHKGRRLQPVAAVTPQLSTEGNSGPRVTNILNMENANHVQFTDHQAGKAPSSGRYSMADEAKKRLGSLVSDVADPEIIRLEKAQKAAEYRRAIEQQVEEKRKRKQEEELKTKLEEEAAERKLNEERERLRKQYEDEQRKIRIKEEAEQRTRQILLEKVKEAEAAADEARRMRLRRNANSALPQDEIIAASVQNVLKLPSPPPIERTRSRLSNSPPLPAPRRTNSGFLATSSNLPSAHGGNRLSAQASPHAIDLNCQSQLQHMNQGILISQQATSPSFPAAPPQMQTIYSSAFLDSGNGPCNNMLHQQVPMIHKCQAYVESMPSPPRTGYSSCSCHVHARLPILTSFYTQTPTYIEDRVLTPTILRLRQRSQSMKNLKSSAVQTDWSMLRDMSPPSSAPSSPVNGRSSRRRKPVSTGGLERDKNKRPPWNANIPNHAYIKNTDRDPNMHTRKKLQELRKQHWEREMTQQNAWQQSTRRRIGANNTDHDRNPRSSARLDSRHSSRSKSLRQTSRRVDTSDTDLSIANNDTGSDFPEHNGYGTDGAIGKGLRDDGVDSSEVSATASAGPLSGGRSTEITKNEPTIPAPAPRKTWKSQSMYIPQHRAESPPVPALLNKMRLQSAEDLNATRGSSHDSNHEESIDHSHSSLTRSKSNNSLSSLRRNRRPPSAASELEIECHGTVNDQKKILSQLSTLRQTLLLKRQELENSISTPRVSRKAKT